MNLARLVRSRLAEKRHTVNDYAAWVNEFMFQGISYGPGIQQTLQGDGEQIEHNFREYVQAAYQRNGVVFACQVARSLVFTEARFAMQRMRGAATGDLSDSPSLRLLEEPWPGGTTGGLLARMLQDADLAGNAYMRITPADSLLDPQIERLRPDWVVIVTYTLPDMHTPARLGYLYWPDGPSGDRDPVTVGMSEVAHWAPVPDPLATYRGMSWLTPVVRETISDSAATTHKIKYWENGATPNLIVSYDPQFTYEQFQRMTEYLDSEHSGVANAYRTMHLAGGADVTVVGNDMEQMDFKNVQGASETRIAAAARVPPVIVGLSEGLQAATYSNYGQARRHFADSWARPYWRSCADALSNIIDVPNGSRLWYDASDISFLQEDEADAAAIFSTKVSTVVNAVNGGFTADSSISAVANGDLTLLEHTGLVSVQMQPPGEDTDDDDEGAPPSPSPADDGDADDDGGDE